jgi:hypothetical protein
MAQPFDAVSTPGAASDWQAESLRLTCFSAKADFDHTKWWRSVVGAESDSVTNQPKQSQYQEQGTLEGQRVLTLQVQHPRIDWLLTPLQPDQPTANFSVLGLFPDVLGQFLTMLAGWYEQCPPLNRFALGGVLLQPRPNRTSGYDTLQAYLHHSVRLDPESSDFLYQINRPRATQTGIRSLRINRLSKWSVALHRTFTILATEDTPTVESYARESACRLEIDLNTAHEFKGPLPHERLVELTEEFRSLALELAARGDVK